MELHLGFWIGVISLALAIPLGVAANLLTPRLVASFDKRKIVTEGRNREQELRAYKHIKELRDGTKDRYAHYMVLATSSVFCAVTASTLVLIGNPHTTEGEVLALMFAIIFALFGLAFLVSIPATARKIQQFDKYKAELEARWGPVEEWLRKLP